MATVGGVEAQCAIPATLQGDEAHHSMSPMDSAQIRRDCITTRNNCFAECLRHSAKALLHSPKPLPSAALVKGPSTNFLWKKGSLPSAFYRALGKDFTKCFPKPLAKKSCRDDDIGTDGCFAKCLQRGLSAKNFSFFSENSLSRATGTWQKYIFFSKTLCLVPFRQSLGKEITFFWKFFAECHPRGTR